jgi:3-deoxy-7-phosphoheptulonate synthase
MASGLTSAIGFKNGTDGSLEVALNALVSAANPHRFLGISPQGEVAIIHTKGNPHTHIVLRGGSGGPNYDSKTIKSCEAALEKLGVPVNIMVDCSHANSSKEHRRQIDVAFEVSKQIREGNTSIMGLMIESNLKEGNQPLSDNLKYGVSVTDACIGWEDTEKLLRQLDQELKLALRSR